MGPLLMALLGMLLLPIFVGSWRTSLVGLAAQGTLLAWIAYRLHPALDTPGQAIVLFDLVVVRGIGAPLLLYRVMRAHHVPARHDVLPPNLLSWTVALVLVMVAFNLADLLVPASGDQETMIAVGTSGLLLGFLILATQAGPFSQIAGAIRIENAVALFALAGRSNEQPLAIDLGQLVIVAVTIGLYRWHLVHLGATVVELPTGHLEEPTL
jgi:hydrogenase-4 component E